MDNTGQPGYASAPLSYDSECDQCHKTGGPLKRCTGCRVASYCSRECQKAAWPRHRLVCRPGLDRLQTSIRPQDLGYPTTISLGSALKRWTQVHKYTFAAIANVVVHDTGLPLLDSGTGTPRTLLVMLRPRTSPADEFALEFGVQSLSFGTRAELAWARETQAQADPEVVAAREGLAQAYGDIYRSAPQPRDAAAYVGVLPATFCLLGTGVAAVDVFPVYAPRAHLLEALVAADRGATDTLAQLVPLCVDAMNRGLVFVPQLSEDGARREVLPKVIKAVRRAGGRKGWQWKTVDPDEAWPALARTFAANWKSDLSPVEIFGIYDKLWPFQKEQKDQASVPVLEEVD